MSAANEHQIWLPGDEMLRRKFGTPDIPVASSLSDDLLQQIQSLDFFFIATCNRRGECDSSYRGKGKDVPAIKVLDSRKFVFPHYMGNGSFRSLGNILENPHIGMLFIDMRSGRRIRVNGHAEVNEDREWLDLFPHSLLTVQVTVEEAYEQNRPVSVSRP